MRLHQLLAVALFAAAAAAGAAEREVLTLTDGRTLTGVYDADAGTIALDGRGTSAVVKIRADQVKDREPAPPLKSATAAVLAGEPAPPLPKAAQPAPPHELAVDIIASADAAMADEEQRHRKAVDDLFQQRRARAAAWLQKANLDDIKLEPLAADPRQSEIVAHQIAERFNSLLERLRQLRELAQRDRSQAANADAILIDIRDAKMLPLLQGR